MRLDLVYVSYLVLSMTPRISDDLKERIVQLYYTDGMKMMDIRDLTRCSIGLVYNVIRNYQDFGQVNNPFVHPAGRPCTLTAEDLAYMEAVIDADPSIYLDEMQSKLREIRDVEVSIASLSRAMTRLNLSRKTVTKAAAERNEEVRAIWEGMMAQYTDPEVFVALDESAVDDKTGQRQYGWSPLGTQCVRRMSFLRGVRYSILPALTTDGIIALEIVEGSITKEHSLKFLHEQVVTYHPRFSSLSMLI